ncbi:MAG: type VI secretion system baseplate subunit TssG [Paludibacterium sp.]|uniref:type VI secretion system baseplate subunit TssG n=1 Tax=Paludibacterium sp. TaxID=1917523 RepID=UPI0025E2C949|nr:type VI secretion system baseplate subunit TssG [Paludibacterium sp.]MBV8046685.1 type VI secretion system baseplate subunit TssG [Paludibacterium sp.]MBV8646815.1 type VI secretion system baseplate subunit TssG [Paludibacterium sp.]
MARQSRSGTRDLDAELAEQAPRFGFFQAARLLGLFARERAPRGGWLPARLRFRTPATLSFPASELVSYRQPQRHEPADDTHDELMVSFMGLTGPSGALPTAYTELLIERRIQAQDTSAHAFFDLFSHRALSLFYGAWRKYRFWVGVEAGEADGFTRNLLDFAGVGLSQLRGRMRAQETLDENLFAYYAGLLSQKPLSAQALAALVQGFFSVPAELEQFVGQWILLPPAEQSQLGAAACELGLSAFAGQRAWDRQTKLSLRLGPMRRASFDALQPGGPAADALKALVQHALGHGLAVDVTLVLDRRDVPPPRLDAGAGLRLGGNVWLYGVGAPPACDPDEMAYTLLH